MLNIPEEIKDLLKQDSVYKNFRVHFPNGERADITNENIVSESVNLQESICSQQTLMFNTCETPMIEFETIGVENIKGKTIECSLEIECHSTVEGAVQRADLDNKWVYPIPYGKFVISSCKKKADMTHRQVIAYNYISYLGGMNPLEKVKMDKALSIDRGYNTTLYHFLIANGYVNPDTYTISYYVSNTRRDMMSSLTVRPTQPQPFYPTLYRLTLNLTGLYHNIGKDYKYEWLWQLKNDKEAYDNAIDDVNDKITEWLGSDFYIDEDDFTLSNFLNQISPNISGTDDTVIFFYDAYARYDDDNYIWLISPFYISYLMSSIFVPISGQIEFSGTGITTKTYDFTILSDYSESLKAIDVTDKILMRDSTNPVTLDITASSNIPSVIGNYYELQGKVCRTQRNGSILPLSLEDKLANPVDTLTPSDYSEFWYDDDMTKPYGKITCSYKNDTGEDAYAEIYIVDESEFTEKTYKVYDISNNLIIKSNQFSAETIQDMLTTMKSNMDDISYMPLNLTLSGRPDLEAGDVVNITTRDNQTIPGLIMQRQLSGIQGLTDSITATEEEEDITSLQLNSNFDSTSGTLSISLVGGK